MRDPFSIAGVIFMIILVCENVLFNNIACLDVDYICCLSRNIELLQSLLYENCRHFCVEVSSLQSRMTVY